MLTLKVAVAVCRGLLESVALTLKLYVPAVVGVPEITPVLAVSLKPAGSAPPLIAQV
jgi:hypothetical protein